MLNGFLLKRYRKYLFQLRLFCFGTAILLTSVLFIATEDPKKIISLMMIVGAMFLVPTIPIGIAFANEVSYPMDETVSQGFVMMASQLFGFVLSYICLGFSIVDPVLGLMVLAVSGSVAAFITLFIKEDLRRSDRRQQVR